MFPTVQYGTWNSGSTLSVNSQGVNPAHRQDSRRPHGHPKCGGQHRPSSAAPLSR